MTTTRCVPALLLLTLLTAAPAQAQGETPPPSAETVQQVLDAEALRLMATLPIQESGRVKPLDTVASFKLLKLRGARAAYTPAPNKRKLTPIEWFTHCLLYPELARTYEVFVIQDSAVLELIGFEVDDKRKRDRYSYDELEPARQRLYEAFAPLQGLRREQLDRLQTQLVDLHSSVLEFELLIHHLDFARYDIASGIHPMVQALFQRENGQPGPARVPFSRLVAEGPRVVSAVRRLSEGDVPPGLEGMRDSGLDAFQQVVQVVQGLGLRSAGLTLIPPTEEDAEAWLSPDDVGKIAFSLDPHVHQEEIALLQRWEALVASRSDPVAFKSVLRGLHDALSGQAAARGEYDKIELEVNFYRWDFFYKALLFFLFGFLAIAFSWLQKPGTRTDKALVFTASSLTGIGLGFSVAGIVFRCILRERPPVSTLYETILFITACAVLTALAMEWINRQRVGLALAPTLGAAGMFFAGRYEMHEAVDTMPQLQAVLDTNFWLATHVTTVTLGYAAGLLAGVMGHVYLIARMFKFKGGDRTWFRGLSRMTYGVIGFGLVFSIVGTILGGVWANDSWGRFWGWDPKENGALMIVLWELAIVHARFGGYIRDWGLAIWAAAGTAVVAFSWWGVNLLGVGLHSYGFTAGVKKLLTGYYLLEGAFVGCCVVWWALNRQALSGKASSAAPETAGTAPTAAPAAEPEPAAEAEPAAEPTPAAEPEPAAESEPEPTAEPEPAAEAEATADADADADADAEPDDSSPKPE